MAAALWRRLWPGRGAGPGEAERDARAADLDRFDREGAPVGAGARDDALAPLLDQIEALALDVYREHGLPIRRGHYRRGPRARRWTFLGERLSPETRWALVMERPPERGWRHGAREDLGRHEESADAAAAAGLLDACARLRRGGEGLSRPEALALALRLGAEWRAMRDLRAAAAPRPDLTRASRPRKAKA